MQDDSTDAYTEVGGRATQDAKAEGGGRERRDEYMDIFGRKCREQIFQHVLEVESHLEHDHMDLGTPLWGVWKVELRLDDCMEAGGSECRDEYMDIFGRKCLEQIFQHILESRVGNGDRDYDWNM